MCFAILLINFIYVDVILDLSCSLIAQVLHQCNKVGNTWLIYYIIIYRAEEIRSLRQKMVKLPLYRPGALPSVVCLLS